MSNVNFFDLAPQASQPRDAIRLEELDAEPYPDGRRVRVSLRITPFGPDDRPNLLIVAQNEAGEELASMSVIESMHNDLSVTIHLRGEEITQGTTYTLSVDLFYEPGEIQDTQSTTFVI